MAENESIVLKPREPFSDAILPQNADELAKFMDQPLTAIAETLTSALAAGPKAWTLMTGHIVQGLLKGKLFQQVCQEIKDLREQGKIPNDFADEKKYKYGFKSWVELLKVIDEETPDADRLDALKAMFYGVNETNATDVDRTVNYQIFQIAKKLSSGELLLMRAISEANRNSDFGSGDSLAGVSHWAAMICKRMGHGLTALVLKDEPALEAEGLISARNNVVNVNSANARLTDLGVRFCKAIENYQIEKNVD